MQEGDQQAGWKYTGAKQGKAKTGDQPKPMSNRAAVKQVSWTASEYIEHAKSVGWYLKFVVVAVLVIGGIYLLTGDLFSVVLLSVLAIAFGVFAARKPAVLQYKLDNNGITIGQKHYPMNLFRSFAVIQEGVFRSITLLPMKRFMPAISLYYSPDDEPAIIEAFSNLLPQESRQQDPLDKLMHRIRF